MPLNALSPTFPSFSFEVLTEIDFRLLQPWKALFPMDLTVVHIVKSASLTQLLKALAPIFCSFFSIGKVFSTLHPLNAASWMVVTPVPPFTAFSLVQDAKAFFPIVFTFFPIVRVFTFVSLYNAFAATSETL